MRKQNKMNNFKPTFKYIFGVNLSLTTEPEFKVAQVLDTGTCVLFDLRQTNKGRKGKAGICLQTPEFMWFKKAMTSSFKNCTLEHNMRVINVEKSIDYITISVVKANGITNKLVLELEEMANLNLDMFETKIINVSNENGYDTDFKPYSYLNEYNA